MHAALWSYPSEQLQLYMHFLALINRALSCRCFDIKNKILASFAIIDIASHENYSYINLEKMILVHGRRQKQARDDFAWRRSPSIDS